MKKFKLFIVIIMCLLIMPFTVFADKAKDDSKDEATTQENKKVKIYFFYGNGCPHCAEAEEFFDSIEEEYGEYYEILAYETWYVAENSALLEDIGNARDENITGVPYILIGNKSWSGYNSSFNDDIISAIKDEYETEVEDRYDIADYVTFPVAEEEGTNDALTLMILILIAIALAYSIVVARKKVA